MSINLREEFDKKIAENLKSAISLSSQAADDYNINIFLIGGIVRDIILDNPIKDIDIAVQGNALSFAEFLEKNYDCKVVSVQENLKTAKVKFFNDVEIDFASTRKEKYEIPGNLPVAYDFGCELEADVKRRDFTINTLAIKLSGNDKFVLIDYFNGFSDIKNKIIKILHNNSFIDDPSRIIRALKFHKRLNFEFDKSTFDLIQNYLANVNKNIPLERIKNELRQYFSIDDKGLYDEIIHTNAYKLISDNPVKLDIDDRIDILKDFNIYKNIDIWFVYIVLLLVKSNHINEKLNLSSYEKKIINDLKLLLDLPKIDINDNNTIYTTYIDKNETALAVYYMLKQDESVKKYFNVLKELKVLITGKDLIEIGFIPSPYFNELFELVLKEKLAGKVKTKDEEIDYIKQFLKKQSR